MAKLTEDARILIALKGGLTVRNFYRAGYKFRRAPEYWCAIQDQGDSAAHTHRSVSKSAVDRCIASGLIVAIPGSKDDGHGHDITHALTVAGRAAADKLGIDLEKAIASPKRPPVPEGLDRWGEYHWKIASAALQDIVRNGMHLEIERRGPENKILFYALTTKEIGYGGRSHVAPAGFKFLEAYVEPVDLGIMRWRAPVECLTANAAGVELVNSRTMLPAA